MKWTLRVQIIFTVLTVTNITQAAGGQTGRQTLYYIPHTHWEGAVFFTREEYLQMGLPHILQALRLMKKYPNYKFTLDQVAYIKPFLERYPEEAAAFKQFVKEGRLGIVGGMDVMPDDVKPGGELFVRQMQYGKRYCRQELGVDVDGAWLVDTFGHHPQIPQLLKLAGYKSFWFCRGVPNNNVPSEFFWKGIDGSTIPAFWLPGFYGLFYGPPNNPDQFAKFFADRFHSLDSHVHAPERVGLAGVDVSEPEEYVPPLIDRYNTRADRPFDILYAIPSDFAKVVAARKDVPTLAGDFNPIFQGTYSSRPELKQLTREIETKLLTAEKLGAINAWFGEPVDNAMTWRAWEPVLFNQTHDLASGVMTDHVYVDTVHSYQFSKRLAEDLVETRFNQLEKHIDTRGPGIPVVVVNPLGWSRTEAAEVEVGFADEGVKWFEVSDPSRKSVAFQLGKVERYGNGGIKRVSIHFVARDLPALGYAVYHVAVEGGQPGLTGDHMDDTLENEFYRVRIDRKTGAITSIYDVHQNWEVLSGPANVVARQEDKGDLWEPYHTLDGGQFIAMTTKQPVPTAANSILSNSFAEKEGTVVHGESFSEFSVSHPFGSGSYSTRIRLYSGIPRIDIETDLVNNEKSVRYQVLFPTSIKNGKYFQEIPFGAVERPVGVEYPAQHWVDYNDGQHGLAVLNGGMPGNLVNDGTMILSLMRAQTLGDYNEGHPSDSGFNLGKRVTFRYSLQPHLGRWSEAAVYKQGLAINHPLIVRKVPTHPGRLPARWGMVEISDPHVVLTSLNPTPDGSIALRIYEAAGKPATGVKIKLNGRVSQAREANLMEDAGARLSVREGVVSVDLHPFEIRTIKVAGAAGRR